MRNFRRDLETRKESQHWKISKILLNGINIKLDTIGKKIIELEHKSKNFQSEPQRKRLRKKQVDWSNTCIWDPEGGKTENGGSEEFLCLKPLSSLPWLLAILSLWIHHSNFCLCVHKAFYSVCVFLLRTLVILDLGPTLFEYDLLLTISAKKAIMGWIVSIQEKYVKDLTLSTPECDLIWK